MNKTSRKFTIKSASRIILIIAVCILIIETVLRFYIPTGGHTSFNHRIPHPVFGWALQPGISYINNMPEGNIPVTHNSLGFRDVEHSIENSHDIFRILVLGDSYMEGYSVKLEDMFHRNIQLLAHMENIDIEIINMGVGGYGTLQEYLVFRDIGQHYKPDIVLLGFYSGNDLRNNSLVLESININKGSMKSRSRPFLDSSDDTAWTITQHDYDGARRRYFAERTRADSLANKLVTHSAFIKAVLLAKKRVERMLSKEDLSLATIGSNYCQEHPEYTDAWKTTKRILERLKNDTSHIGAELFVFTVPALYEADKNKILFTPNRDLVCRENPPAYNRLKGILNGLDIEYIDLLPSFRKSMKNDTHNLFRRSDGHWNENGHRIAADIVYSAIKDHINLKTKHSDRTP